MHYYQFNIGDYQSHTSHLSEIEDLAYRRLLDWYYLHEKPLPLDVDEISRLIRMRLHCDCIAIVLREFFNKTDDGYISERADRELSKVGDKSEKAKKSAVIRWEKEKNKQKDDANALPTQSERNATHNTLHITQDTLHKTQVTAKEKKRLATPINSNLEFLDDWKDFCYQLRPDLNSSEIFAQFKDYWLSTGEKKADWFATWRSWVRRQKKQNNFEPTWVTEKKAWIAEATGQSANEIKEYEPDIFDMAMLETRKLK